MTHPAFILLFAAAPIFVAGCAAPAPVVRISGALPAPSSYELDAGSLENGGEGWPKMVVSQLADLGFSQADLPRYLIQVSLADRPEGTLAFPLATSDVPSQEKVGGSRHTRRVTTLTLTIEDHATGQSLYGASASLIHRDAMDDMTIKRLQGLILPEPTN